MSVGLGLQFRLELAAIVFEFVLKSLSCYLSLIRPFVHIVTPVIIAPYCCHFSSVR